MKESYKVKLPLITLGIELAIIILLYLIFKHEFNNEPSLTSQLTKHGTDDAITGWLVIPAFFVDMFAFLGYIVVNIMAVVYFTVIGIVLGWNMLFHYINKKNGLGLFLLAIAPAILFVIFNSYQVVGITIHLGWFILVLYNLPALLIVGMLGIQIYSYIKNKALS